MISQDTVSHFGAMILAIVLAGAVDITGVLPDTDTGIIAVIFLFYGIVLGGAHFYLAHQGHEGMLPPRAHWRYVGLLAILFGSAWLLFLAGDKVIAGVELSTVVLGVVVFVLLVYIFTATTSGYRQTRTND